MSENDIVRARRLPDGSLVQVLPDGTTRPMESRTNWARFDALTEEEVEANALSDPDNPPLTKEELARMRPVPNPREIRRRMHLTQEQFAERFHLALGTLRDWEQGVRMPDSTARAFLQVIDRNPQAVVDALKR